MNHRQPEHQFYRRLTTLLRAGQTPYLCQVIEAKGSAPRGPGAQMLVLPDGTSEFTVGGGAIEAQVIRQARLAFDAPRAFVREYHLGDLGMHCGGTMRVLFEPATGQDLALYQTACDWLSKRLPFALVCRLPNDDPDGVAKALLASSGTVKGDTRVARMAQSLVKHPSAQGAQTLLEDETFVQWVYPPWRLQIFGAGHVGAKLAEVAAATGVFEVHVTDDRAEFADPKKLPFCQTVNVVGQNYEGPLPLPDARTFVAVITRCHATDKVVVQRLLTSKAPFAYLGMIGSVPKRARLFKLLQQEGISRQQLEAVTTPMGLAIGGKDPGEIAVSMLAQMVQRKNELSQTLGGGLTRWQRKQHAEVTG